MEKRANFILTAILIFLSLLLTAYSNSNLYLAQFGNKVVMGFTSPIAGTFVYSRNWVVNYFDNYINLFHVQEENQKLQLQVEFLQAENARFRESEIENQRLHQILKFSVLQQQEGLVANVIAYSNKSQQQTITIDRGSNDGVELKQVAVDGIALLGQVISVTGNSSKILLISDPLSGVDSISQETRTRGVVQGDKENLLLWKYLPKDQPVAVGSRIITSGADGVFPHGLSVGVVIQVDNQRPGMFQEIFIKPASNLNRIETVYLLKTATDES